MSNVRAVAEPTGKNTMPITSMVEKWADDFGGTALDPNEWDVNVVSPGITYAIANSELRVTMGTTAGAELWLTSRSKFSVPFDVKASLKLSQRLAENEVYLEIVEVDLLGNPVPNSQLGGEWRNRSGVAFKGNTSANAARLEVISEDSGVVNAVATTSGITTTSDFDMVLEYRAEDLIWSGVASDNIGAKSSNPLRSSRQAVDPNAIYKFRLRFKNVGTPASSTLVTIYRTLVQDIQELIAEISSGRGDAVGGKGISVNVAQGFIGPATDVFTEVSGAITSTTTTTFNSGRSNGAGQIQISVSAVSGTSPTLDVVYQESDDNGTNWYDVYHFERIMTTGVYRSPPLKYTGNKQRIVQTVTGTSPSFTRTVQRLGGQFDTFPLYRKFISRAVDPNTANSNGATWNIEGSDKLEIAVHTLTFANTFSITVDLSDDGNNWVPSGTVVAVTAAGVARSTVINHGFKFARLRTTVAGTGNALGSGGCRLTAWR